LLWARPLVQVSHILTPFRERDGRSFFTGRLRVAWRPEHGFAL
jgi:hypothetical protein